METLLLLALLSPAQEWEYREGSFVEAATGQRKSPEEFLRHAIELRAKKSLGAARDALQLLLARLPAKSPLLEAVLYEHAQTLFEAGLYHDAHMGFEAYLIRHAQSDRAPAARRMQMASAFELGRSTSTGIDLLHDALKRYPREEYSAEFYQKLGMHFYEDEDFDAAEVEFIVVLEQYADSPLFVPALYMLGRTRERRFDAVDYDVKPLKDARRHYERFVEEAERMRKLPDPASKWVDDNLGAVRERIAAVNEILAEKEMRTGEYYLWKGYPKSAAISYQAVLKYFPKTRIALQARKRLDDLAPAPASAPVK